MDRVDSVETRQQSKLVYVCLYILGTMFCERIAFYGFKENLINYFKKYGASNSSAASMSNTFTASCYLFSLVGGWIADTRLARYKTILFAAILYILGCLLLVASAAIPGIKVENGDDANDAQWVLLWVCLFILAASAGGIKPNLLTFGADQFNDNIDQDQREKKSFFNWFYFFINLGAVMALIFLIKIQDNGHWDVAYGLAVLALVLSIIIFISGTSKYTFAPVLGSPLQRFFSVTYHALSNRRKSFQAPLPSPQKHHWLDWATTSGRCTSEEVHEIKLAYRPSKIFLNLTFSNSINATIISLFILQAEQMDRRVNLLGFDYVIPSASMGFFNATSILIFLPIYDLAIIPFLKRVFNFTPTSLQRMGTGFIPAILMALYFGILEVVRLHKYDQGEYHIIHDEDGEDVEVVKLSVLWQIPIRILSAFMELFTAVGSMEFFYSQAPDSMRSIMTSLSLVVVAIGSYFSAILIIVVDQITSAAGRQWISTNLNKGHLDSFCFLMIGLNCVVFVWFIVLAKNYEYKQADDTSAMSLERQPIIDPNFHNSDSSQKINTENKTSIQSKAVELRTRV